MLIKREQGFLQRFYLIEIFTGLVITMKNWFFGKNITYQYPEQRRNYSPRYRGQHYIKTVNAVENCTACMLCPTVCPADCIHIEAGERDDKEKYPVKFEIEILRSETLFRGFFSFLPSFSRFFVDFSLFFVVFSSFSSFFCYF